MGLTLSVSVSVGIQAATVAALIFLITRPIDIAVRVVLVTLGVVLFLALIEEGAEVIEDLQENLKNRNKRQADDDNENDEENDENYLIKQIRKKMKKKRTEDNDDENEDKEDEENNNNSKHVCLNVDDQEYTMYQKDGAKTF